MEKTKQIQNLVTQLYFLPWEESQRIITGAVNASAEAMDSLIDVLKKALKKQEDMVKKMITADPDFPKKLDALVQKNIHDAAVKIEEEDQSASAEKFANL